MNTLTYKVIGYYTQTCPAGHNFTDLEAKEVGGGINETEDLICESHFPEKSPTVVINQYKALELHKMGDFIFLSLG